VSDFLLRWQHQGTAVALGRWKEHFLEQQRLRTSALRVVARWRNGVCPQPQPLTPKAGTVNADNPYPVCAAGATGSNPSTPNHIYSLETRNPKPKARIPKATGSNPNPNPNP
jgi:hypothetical protein